MSNTVLLCACALSVAIGAGCTDPAANLPHADGAAVEREADDVVTLSIDFRQAMKKALDTSELVTPMLAPNSALWFGTYDEMMAQRPTADRDDTDFDEQHLAFWHRTVSLLALPLDEESAQRFSPAFRDLLNRWGDAKGQLNSGKSASAEALLKDIERFEASQDEQFLKRFMLTYITDYARLSEVVLTADGFCGDLCLGVPRTEVEQFVSQCNRQAVEIEQMIYRPSFGPRDVESRMGVRRCLLAVSAEVKEAIGEGR